MDGLADLRIHREEAALRPDQSRPPGRGRTQNVLLNSPKGRKAACVGVWVRGSSEEDCRLAVRDAELLETRNGAGRGAPRGWCLGGASAEGLHDKCRCTNSTHGVSTVMLSAPQQGSAGLRRAHACSASFYMEPSLQVSALHTPSCSFRACSHPPKPSARHATGSERP